MPIYEYECPRCGRFDVIQKASEEPLIAKPECSDSQCPRSAKRLISASAFHLKGGGWYKSDYSGSSKSKADGGSKEKDNATPKESSGGDADSSKKDTTPSKGSGGKGGCGSGCGCH